MTKVSGTLGYEESIESFIRASLSLDFEEVNKEFLAFLPSSPALVLDLGAGVGQNSAALARLGHQVFAVEPLEAFLEVARIEHDHKAITWLQDALPTVDKLSKFERYFQFILLDGVWHHLPPSQRAEAMFTIKRLLHKHGHCAISLRNGPPGAGKYVFPTSIEEIVQLAHPLSLNCQVISHNQPSKLKNKEQVKWCRVVISHED